MYISYISIIDMDSDNFLLQFHLEKMGYTTPKAVRSMPIKTYTFNSQRQDDNKYTDDNNQENKLNILQQHILDVACKTKYNDDKFNIIEFDNKDKINDIRYTTLLSGNYLYTSYLKLAGNRASAICDISLTYGKQTIQLNNEPCTYGVITYPEYTLTISLPVVNFTWFSGESITGNLTISVINPYYNTDHSYCDTHDDLGNYIGCKLTQHYIDHTMKFYTRIDCHDTRVAINGCLMIGTITSMNNIELKLTKGKKHNEKKQIISDGTYDTETGGIINGKRFIWVDGVPYENIIENGVSICTVSAQHNIGALEDKLTFLLEHIDSLELKLAKLENKLQNKDDPDEIALNLLNEFN